MKRLTVLILGLVVLCLGLTDEDLQHMYYDSGPGYRSLSDVEFWMEDMFTINDAKHTDVTWVHARDSTFSVRIGNPDLCVLTKPVLRDFYIVLFCKITAIATRMTKYKTDNLLIDFATISGYYTKYQIKTKYCRQAFTSEGRLISLGPIMNNIVESKSEKSEKRSSGDSDSVEVPYIVGLDFTEHLQKGLELYFVLNIIYETNSERIPGTILKVNPTPGTHVKKGSKIDLMLSIVEE